MNTEYIENFRLIGFEVTVCKSMKEFIQEIKIRSSWADFTGTSFRKYMNDELNGYWDCISDGWTDEDACIFIGYKDGTKYSFLPALGVEGKFKETGIKWAILSDGYGYTVYNDDLSVEWENIELDELEEEAIKKRIPIETLRLQKKLSSEQSTSESKEAPKKEGKAEPEEVAEVPGASEPEQEQGQSEPSTSEPEQKQSKNEIPQKGGEEKPEEVPGASEQEQSKQGTSERKIVYRIDILKALKEAGYNQGRIKREKLLNGSAIDKIRAGSTDISLKTLNTICNLLNVEPGDILTMQ